MSLKRTKKPAVMHTLGHQTPAVQQAVAAGWKPSGGSGKRRRSSGSTKKNSSTAKRSSKKRKSSPGRPKAGSPAAKAWGKKMARLRKKKG